jgi:putative membrane-bound dehydrogenase-like protein
MNRVRGFFCVALALSGWLAALAGAGASAGADKDGVFRLFNGKDLAGFYTFLEKKGKNNDPDKVFTVVDEMIRVSGREYGYLITENEYENYHLTVEFKWGSQTHPPRKDKARDSGILFHVTGPDKIWPKSLEFQMIEGGTGDLILVGGASLDFDDSFKARLVPWSKRSNDGNRLVSGQVRCNDRWSARKDVAGFRDPKDLEKPHGEWNVLELIADGKEIRYLVNGTLVFKGAGADPAKGKILLQSEGAEVFFRRIDLKPLKKSPRPKEPSPLQAPPGFVVERVAGPPLVERPMFAAFDERGRLFVCDSSGFNLLKGKSDILLKDPPHAIRLLEDREGRGRFDKSTLFADKLTFPMGVLWHDGALYTASAPSLWRLEDTDGNGVADRRQELVAKFDFEGNGCDIHGPFLGPDGRIYWANCNRGFEIRQPDGKILKGKTAGLLRARADGSEVEIVCAGGMDNPVEAAFTAEGEALATVNLFIGAPRPRHDAIIHCVEGGVFPYRAVPAQFKRTGELLPASIDLGWVAPSGLMRYRSDAFGAEYRDNLFSAQFNTHRVQRHLVERHGATFRARTEDFLVCTDPDFHPTDVLEDADGSLLVVDTGGWFLRGCPTSRIAKPDIKGAIYRVSRKDAPKLDDPRGLALKWEGAAAEELAKRLSDPRFAVRDRAVHELGKLGAKALPALGVTCPRAATATARRNAVWALTRMDGEEARTLVRGRLSDGEMTVRLAAAYAVGLHRDAVALPELAKRVVSDPSPAVRRETATALGRIRKSEAVPALLESIRAGGDRFLEHALIYALIDIANREATLKGLQDTHPQVRRAALIALDQMDGGDLTPNLVTPLLNTPDPGLQQTARAILIAHPAWSQEALALVADWLRQPKLDETRQDQLRGALLAFCKAEAVQDLVARTLRRDQTPAAIRLLLLETMAHLPLDHLPATWAAEARWSLDRGEEAVVRQAVATIRATRLTECDEALLNLARDSKRPTDLRLASIAAAAPRLAQLEAGLFDFAVACLGSDRPPLERRDAAQGLGQCPLSDKQRDALTSAVGKASALELPHLLAAYEGNKNAAVGRKLVAALDAAPGREGLTLDIVRQTLADYPPEVRAAAKSLFKLLEADTARQRIRLAELQPLLTGGDAGKGRELFFGNKASCSACHAVRAEGGRIGPDLSTIGGIRSGQDVLESIVFPSASFARGYEPYLVDMKDGKTHSGIIGRETPEAIYLITADRAEVRLPRQSIDTLERGRVSIMPQGLGTQLSREELADLIAFLKSLR